MADERREWKDEAVAQGRVTKPWKQLEEKRKQV